MDIRIGHLNILDHLILAVAGSGRQPDGLQCSCPPGIHIQQLNAWDQVARGLESGDINAAFISIPLAMALYQKDTDIALLMFTHRGGSRMAVGTGVKQIRNFKGKSLLIPHGLSVQHLLLHRFLDSKNLIPETGSPQTIFTEPVPSFLMPEMAANDRSGDIAAFICEEPFGTRAVDQGGAKPLLITQDLWPDHPGSALVVHRTLLDTHEKKLARLVAYFFHTAAFIDRQIQDQGQKLEPALLSTAAAFLKQPEDLVRSAIEHAGITFSPSLMVPDFEPLEVIAGYMADTMNLLPGPIDLNRFVAPLFARQAFEEIPC